jgi:glycyl-tRNA synthetase beta chain
MPNLLLELFSEELPAGMQPKAESWLTENLRKALREAKLDHGNIKSFRTPRRIAVIVEDLPESQPDVSEERKGPATEAPEQAIEGFLRSTGLTKDQLETREIKSKNYFFAVINQQGKPTTEALKPLLEKLIADLPWQKSMRWGDYPVAWARPLQNICCLLDDTIIPIKFGHLTANNQTYGHRFLAPQAITVNEPAHYEDALRAAHVMADGTLRENTIKEALESAAKAENLKLMEDPALLREVTGLVEWPVILTGTIDDNFMDLPPEVMRSEMRNHQKYFTLLKKDGTAASKFLIVSNLIASDGGKAVIAGNERVLRARLSDGQFFYQQDQKQPLAQWNEKLSAITFHAKLGSIADKVKRITNLSKELAKHIEGAEANAVERAANLCKSDLPTGMVGEFPELQGIIGHYYAIAQGEPAEVAHAIRDHYLPLGPQSPVPTAPVSIALALADKLDNLISLFAVGEAPTGSKDPFALRRAALGVIRIILENELRIPLNSIIHPSQWEGSKSSISGEGSKNPHLDHPAGSPTSPSGRGDVYAFLFDRLRGILKDQGLRYDVIEAVLNHRADDDILRMTRKIQALQQFMESQDASALLTAYGRAANILAKSDAQTDSSISTDLLEQQEERALFEAIENTSNAVSTHLAAESYSDALSSFAVLRAPVDAFFDQVTVNAEDAKLRQNRLNLLSHLVTNMQDIADFSQIQQAA